MAPASVAQGLNSWDLYLEASNEADKRLEESVIGGGQRAPNQHGQDLGDAIAGTGPVWKQWRTARKMSEFLLPLGPQLPEFDLRSPFQLAAEALEKGKVEPALDYLAAVSRLDLGPGVGLWRLNCLREDRTNVAQLRTSLARLPREKRRLLLRFLDDLINQQASIFGQLVAQRDSRLLVFQSTNLLIRPVLGSSAGMRAALHSYVQLKYDRWIFFVRNGDFDGIHQDTKEYWKHPVYGTGIKGLVSTLYYYLLPAELMSHTVDFPTPNQPDQDVLIDIVMLCNEFRLDWESWRLTLALELYQEEKHHLPESLEQLVESGYLARLPLDPYRAKGSELAGAPDRVIGYDGNKAWSIGWDGVDQQGRAVIESYSSGSTGDRILFAKPEP